MATTVDEIREWFARGVAEGAEYMIVWCDTFDYEDYPDYYPDRAATQEALNEGHLRNMQKAMEVYDLRADREEQLGMSRCWALRPSA